jgi:hypothetical protein
MGIRTLGLALVALTLVDPSGAGANDRRVQLGALGGASLTDITVRPGTVFDSSGGRSGHGGVFVSVSVSAPVSVEGRILWEPRSVDLSQANVAAQARMDYVGIPVLVRVSSHGPRMRPFLVVGPELLLKAGARLTAKVDGIEVEEEDFEDQVRGYDVALDAGVGAEITVGRPALVLEALYSHGLLNVAVPATGGRVDVAKTRAFRLSVGLRF